MDAELTERRLANGLLVLGLAMLAGLLSLPYVKLGAALLPALGALGVLFAKPVGNRMMVFGLALLSGLLLIALWRFDVFFTMLDVLVAVILLGAGVLKHRGKW